MKIDTLLREEIQSELNELKEMEVGTDKYRTTIDGVTKLVDRVIEMDKIEIEREEKVENRETDAYYREQEMIGENKDRFAKNCISVAGIVIPVIVTIWGTVKSFEFEKEGTITTIMGRGFIQKLLPKK